MIIADADPGCGGTWVDPYGHTHGGWSFRLVKTNGKSPPPVYTWKLKTEVLRRDGLAILSGQEPIVSGGLVD